MIFMGLREENEDDSNLKASPDGSERVDGEKARGVERQKV